MQLAIGIVLMIGSTVAANLLLKAGAMVPPAERAIFGTFDWKSLLGFALFGAAGVIYSWVLNWLPLNVAQSIAASQFVAVILASAVVLAEPIPPSRLIGIALITAGIVLVSATYNTSPAGDPPASRSADRDSR
jgi:drug/metabolite transporter (DMT)-like permease